MRSLANVCLSICLSVEADHGMARPMATPSPPRLGQNASERLLASVLQLNLTQDSDFGVFACWVSNATATFTLRRAGRDVLGTETGHPLPGARVAAPWGPSLPPGSASRCNPTPNPLNLCQGHGPHSLSPRGPAEVAGHVSAVLAALLVLALLVLLAGLYVRCRLSLRLWYRNRYGELELNGEQPRGLRGASPSGTASSRCHTPVPTAVPRREAVRCLRVPRWRPG